VREEHFLYGRRKVSDVQHGRPFGAHDEGRLLHRVVADCDDEIGLVDRLMDIIALGERGRTHIEVGSAGDRALAHLGVDIRNPHTAHEIRQGVGEKRPARRCAQHHERPLGFQD
jgi:hypothetical protein